MKICFVNYSYYAPEAVLTGLYEYSQYFADKGHDVTVCVKQHEHNYLSRSNLRVVSICKDLSHPKLTRIVFLNKVRKILNRDQFDVVHLFNSPTNAFLVLLCRNQKAKWIFDIQTGGIGGGIKTVFFNRLLVLASKVFDEILVLDHPLRKVLFGDSFQEKITVIPIGINCERLRKKERKSDFWKICEIFEKHTILIYIGRLDFTRRLDLLLESIRIVKEKYSGRFKCVFLGGNSSEVSVLERVKNKLDLSDVVLFLGQVPYVDVPDYLKNSDIGLAYIPKNDVYDIQPPLKTYEYLGSGLATVATNTDCNMDIIENGVNGVIASDDPEDYASKILKLLTDEELCYRVKLQAAKSVNKFDWSFIASIIEKMYMRS